MNKRQSDLLTRLYESKSWVLGKDLALLLNVTDRTIRNDILKISKEYGDDLILSHARLGYSVDIKVYEQVIQKVDHQMHLDSDARIVYIMHQLLFEQEELDLFQLQEHLLVSSSSLDQDIKKLRELLAQRTHLTLHRKSYKLSLEGSEDDKRFIYKNMLYKETTGNFLNISHISELFLNIDLNALRVELESIAKKHDYDLKSISIPRIMMHLGISIERMMNGNYAPSKIDGGIDINPQAHEVVQEFFEYLALTYDIEVRESEVQIFSILIMGDQGLSERQANDHIKSKLIEDILKEVILDLQNNFAIDVSLDDEFKLGLQLHFFSLMERDSRQEQADSLFIEDIKRRYPLIFEIACRVGNTLKQDLDITVNESEIAFISLHLGSAFERIAYANRYKAVLIYPYNKVLSTQYLNKINSRFDERLQVVECLSFIDQELIESIKPDIILTITHIALDFKGPIIELSPIFNHDDERLIMDALSLVESMKTKKHFKSKLLSLFSENLFNANMTFKNRDEVINFMGQEAIDHGFAVEPYVESVFEREAMSATDFNYGIAVPHSVNASHTLKSGLGIMILKEPIQWGKFKVRVVIMLTITREDHTLLRTFFDWLNDILAEPAYLLEFLNIKTYDELIGMISAEA